MTLPRGWICNHAERLRWAKGCSRSRLVGLKMQAHAYHISHRVRVQHANFYSTYPYDRVCFVTMTWKLTQAPTTEATKKATKK